MPKGFKKFLSETAVGAGNTLLKYYNKPHRIKRKDQEGIVTEADKASEAFILKKISRNFPSSSIITEESGEYLGDRSLRWIIDPLDGTTNYAHGYPWFCVSIAVYEGNQPLAGAVYQPLSKELFIAERGKGTTLNGKRVAVSKSNRLRDALLTTGFYYSSRDEILRRDMDIFERITTKVLGLRRPGAAALDLAYVAAGRSDGYWQRGLACWDVAAAVLLISEAGGKVTNYSGKKTTIFEKELIASNSKLHRQMVSLIKET